MQIKNWITTVHGAQRYDEREISIEIAKSIILNPTWKTQQDRGEHGGFQYRFEKMIWTGQKMERLRVVAEIKKENCWLITGYNLDRPRGRR
jgi:hypothetical protein